jgi:hypothetical protein
VNDGIICRILLVLNVVSIAQPLYKGVGLYVIQRQLYIIGFISAVQHLCKGLPCTSAIDQTTAGGRGRRATSGGGRWLIKFLIRMSFKNIDLKVERHYALGLQQG